MIIYTLDKSEFVNLFNQYNRSTDFTRASREALFDYYDELSDDIDEPFEADIIAICCDWCEYTYEDLLADYSEQMGIAEDEAWEEGDGVDGLREHTTVIEVDHTDGTLYLVQSF